MPRRHIVFATDHVYHILNRGVAKAPIFRHNKEYQRFLNLLSYYQIAEVSLSYSRYKQMSKSMREKHYKIITQSGSCLVDIFAFCFMPNHFHLLLKQTYKNGIHLLLRKIQNGYAKYVNFRHQRVGPLFQSMFKAIRVETDEQLLHVSRYIHLNPTTSYLVTREELKSFRLSSLPYYLGEIKSDLVTTTPVLSLAGKRSKYQEFVFDQVDYQRKLSQIEHLALEQT